MLATEVKRIIEEGKDVKINVRRTLNIDNIRRLKDRGLIRQTNYNIPNHLYFYLGNGKNE